MRYFVVTPDGQRYGPADIPTLQQWVQEGRIVPSAMLEEEISGNRVQASAVPGLNFGGGAPTAQPTANPYSGGGPTTQQQNPYSQNPYQQGSNYYRGPGNYTPAQDPMIQKDINNAWVGGVLGLCCCFPFAIWGLICAKRAKDAGHPNGNAAYIFNIVVLCLAVLGLIVRIAMLASGDFPR